MATYENWGDFFWDGQIDQCRRNLLGIRDPEQLERAERKRTARRATELATGLVDLPRTFDLGHVQAIHRHLFQDVYEWAGQLRPVELVRPAVDPNAPAHQFVPPHQIGPLSHQVFAQLGDPRHLGDRTVGERVERLAQTYAGLNVLHPFVEGNGRTQRIFLDHAAAAMGLRIDWTRMPNQNQVMAEAFTAGYRPVEQALHPCITPTKDSAGGRDDLGQLRQLRAAFPTQTTQPDQRTPGRRAAGNPLPRRDQTHHRDDRDLGR